MSLTVGGAFSTFRTGTVDLDPTWTSTARGSRDYLFSQLRSRATADATFPRLTGGYINFGSFARRTKIRPLDDIDMMPILNGTGTSQYLYSSDLNYWLRIDSDTSPLARFNDGYGYVNSTKVLNAIRNSLGAVHNYRLAVIKKTMQAVTLQLSTYSWVFDIVPAVGVSNGTGGTDHYLIPDGRGNWIRTDPRIDQSNLTTVNQRHTNYFIPTLRLLKYWNMKRSRRRLPSYYFETLVMRVLEYATPIRSYSDAIDYFFRQCPIYLGTRVEIIPPGGILRCGHG